MKTLDDILNGMEKAVEEDMPISPVQWLDGAIKVNALRGTLDNQIAEFEDKLVKIEAEYIKQGNPQSTAKTLAKADTDYKAYREAEKKSKRIEEFLRLAKKRSTINEINV